MHTPKVFTPCFAFGVPSVPSVSNTTNVIENKGLNSIYSDTPTGELGVPEVPDGPWADTDWLAGTPDTLDDPVGVPEQSISNQLMPKGELDSDTLGTPGTPENQSRQKLMPDTGPLPKGLNASETRIYQAIAAQPGLSRAQLCEVAGVTLEEFNASTPILCGRQLTWPDYLRHGGWITASQARAVRS